MTQIAESAHVDSAAEVDDSVLIGPNCFIGAGVRVGADCVLDNNVTLTGNTTIGCGNRFFPNAVVGTAPQDLKYRGEPTRLIIGERNVFRENCTVNTGTEVGGGVTQIGSDNLLMTGVHVAHDCILEDHLTIANNVLMAGHVKLESNVSVMGGAAMHHFVTVGRYAYVAGFSRVVRDIPPFMKSAGDPVSVRGANVEGLKRARFDEREIERIKEGYRFLYRNGTPLEANITTMLERDVDGYLLELVEFLRRSASGVYGRHRETLRADK